MKCNAILTSVLLFFGLWTVAQNRVGIGTNAPHASASLDITSTTGGLLVPRMTAIQRRAIPTPTSGLIVYQTNVELVPPFDAPGYYIYFGAWKTLLDQDSKFWYGSSTRNWVYNGGDSIGIGTTSPNERLHIFNGKLYMQDNRSNQNPFVIFDNPNTDFKEGGLQWKRSGDTLASIKYVNNPNLRNYIKISPQEGTAANNMYISTNGTSIGTADPQTLLHLRNPGVDEILRLEGANPMIKFRNASGLFSYTDIGFLQTVDNDLRIGTFSTNTGGDFIIRTGGNDNVFVSDNGNVGIGPTITPLAKLSVVGGQDAGLNISSNGFAMFGVGTSNSTNLLIDNNEIMVRNGYTLPGTLTLQNNGGELVSGARVTINKDGQALKLYGAVPNLSFATTTGTANSFLSQESDRLFIGVNNGKVQIDGTQIAIGTVSNAVAGYKLTVTGKVICEEVKVKLNGAWPDYVFAGNYAMHSLPELEKYITANKHLPNIPAAAEIENDGIELGAMQKKLMEKVEELTLYIIQQQKDIEVLKKKVNSK
ncbi:MAG: hypothetical protein ABIX01_04630 [Chitinophagaceae bacterium]